MLKKLFCVLITFIILIPMFSISVSADTTTGSNNGEEVENWNVESWKSFFIEDFDPTSLSNYEEYANDYFKTNGYTVNDSLIVGANMDANGMPAVLRLYVTDGKFQVSTSKLANGNTCYSFTTSSDATYTSFLNIWNYGGNIKPVSESSFSNFIFLVYSDINLNASDTYFYYSKNPYQTFLDYLRSAKYDDMFYDVYPLEDGHQNIIRFYDCWDSYYGKYTYDFYDDKMLNYLNSSYSIDSPIYYQGKSIETGYQLEGADLQHNEIIYVYIPVPDDFSITNANDYLTSIGTAVHYENGPIDFNTWYNSYIVPWLDKFSIKSNYKLITLKNVSPSTSDNPTVNSSDTKKDVNLLRLTFPSAYTFLESTVEDGGFIMSGCRTMSTAQRFDISNGAINDSIRDGIGSDIDGGDYSDDKEADELLADGWKNGYPNKSSYPYKITINKNGYILYEIYFDKRPVIEANFFSDSQIAYDVDFNYTRGYVYAKQQGCYLDFDFRTKIEDDVLSSDGTLSDSITDEVNEYLINYAKAFVKIYDCLVDGYSYITSGEPSEVNYSKYINEKIIRLWTNYTGQLTGVYRGYYVQFNWDLESDEDFIKNNSDDDHNYTDDFLNDGDGFIDNNGNIHGGAVEAPTESPINTGFNNSDFSFDENGLWGYADSFLGFCARAFKVLPAFCWQLIACSIVLIIMLRVLGR